MSQFKFFARVLAVGGLIALTQPAHAQSAAAAPVARPQQDHQAMQMPMMDMQQKMAEMKAMDARLDALVTKMNAAKGTLKVDAIAELLTTMVQTHKAMHEEMMQMHDQMMMQMHGQMAMPGGAK